MRLALPYMELDFVEGVVHAGDDWFTRRVRGHRKVRDTIKLDEKLSAALAERPQEDVERSRRRWRTLYLRLFCEPMPRPAAPQPRSTGRSRSPRQRERRGRRMQRGPLSSSEDGPEPPRSLDPTEEHVRQFLDFLVEGALKE